MIPSCGTLPSPSLSDCDSLAGIEDLDAYLNAQGPLSLFSTPGLRNDEKHRRWQAQHNQAVSLQTPPTTPPDDSFDAQAALELAVANAARYAAAFAGTCCAYTTQSNEYPLEALTNLFAQLQLQPEVIAVAYAIAQASIDRELSMSSPNMSLDMHVLSTLVLADIYTNDHPSSSKRWLSLLADKRGSPVTAAGEAIVMPTTTIVATEPGPTVQQLNDAILSILQVLDWNIHSFCSPVAVEASMAQLTSFDSTTLPEPPQQEQTRPSIKVTTITDVCLTDCTPQSSSSSAATILATPATTRFLRLL